MSLMRVSKLAGSWSVFSGLVLIVVLLAGCKTGSTDPEFAESSGAGGASVPAVQAAPDAPPAIGVSTNDSADIIHVQDALTITLADLPYVQPPIEERVKDDGTINLIENQTFHVAGKKRGEVEIDIHDRYVPKLFKTMTVSVVQQKDTQLYYVGGEVKLPGRQVYISRTTVLKAIQSAGDFTDFARKDKVILTRADGRKIIVNCKKARYNQSLDPEVFPNDRVDVPRRMNPIW